MSQSLPLIAIPIGDPAGIGPEIVAKSLMLQDIYQWCRPLVIGDAGVMEWAARVCGADLKIQPVADPETHFYEAGKIHLIDLKNVDSSTLKVGAVQAASGKAAFEYIAYATKLAMDRVVDAIATTPINKESLKQAHINYIGHTEIFADLSGTKDPLTMFQVENLRVFFLTRHVSLRQACDLITKERVIDYVIRCTEAARKLGVEGTMAVAGLNPHSGEHGLFGDEEVKYVEPAVKELQSRGYDVCGPVPADSVFHQALMGKYKTVLSLYHDQGHIATKTYNFEKTISITNGMPFLRTSVDHGTALDISGTGKASAVSMIEAIRLAAFYAKNFVQGH